MSRRFEPTVLIRSTLASLALLASAACQPAAEQPVEAPKGERVEAAELGFAIAELPAFFKVQSNDGAVIELVPADPAVEGVLTLMATEPETGGINLVAAIEEHKASLQSRTDGVFKGQRELGSPIGAAFYSRGLFTEGERGMEETKIFALHPAGDRKLVLTYLYPAGEDSGERLMDQLFGVFGELEILESPPGDAAGQG